MELTQRIDQFEQTYMKRLRRWAGMVGPEELDEVVRMVGAMQKDSEAITGDIVPGGAVAQRWRIMLQTAAGLVPAVEKHIIRLRNDAQGALNNLDRGRHIVSGYRKHVPTMDSGRLDSEG